MAGPGFKRSKTQERLDEAKINKLELELLQKKQDLVRAADVQNAWLRAVISFRTRLLTIPSAVAPLILEFQTPEEVEEVLRAEITHALNELSRAGMKQVEVEIEKAEQAVKGLKNDKKEQDSSGRDEGPSAGAEGEEAPKEEG